jgi:outer membrane protein assembly factor BamB
MTRLDGPRALAMLAAASTLVTAGCWPQPGGNPANSYWNAIESELTVDNVATLHQVWSAEGDLDAVFGRHVLGMTGGGDGTTPGTGFVKVTSLDAGTGAQNWSTDIAPGGIAQGLVTGSAVVVGDQVWAEWLANAIGPGGTHACAGGGSRLDLETGAPVGTTNLLNAIMTTGNLVAVRETSFLQDCTFGPTSGVRVLDGATRAPIWETNEHGLRPVAAGNQLVIAENDALKSFALSGCGAPPCQPVWTSSVAGPNNVSVEHLAADGDRLYAMGIHLGTFEMIGVDISDGSVAWRTPGPAPLTGGIAAFDGIVYTTAGVKLLAYDGEGCVPGCQPLWTGVLPGGVITTNIAGAGGVVYALTEDGTVSAFDAKGCGAPSCPPLAQVSLGGKPSGTLIVASGHVYASVTATTPPLSRIVALGPA